MERGEAYDKIIKAGYTWVDAYYMLNYLLGEHFCPSSRNKASKLRRVQEALRNSGVDPETIEFHPGDKKWGP